MGWTSGRLFEQGRLISERERALDCLQDFSGSGKVMRARGSFGSWEAAHLNGSNSKPRKYRKLCSFKKMLSQ